MIARAVVLSALILGTGLYGTRASGLEEPVARRTFAELPGQIGPWTSHGDVALDADTLGVLGVDDYVNRTYESAGSPPVNLYVGYYASQRQGDTIHSPQNCLPGAGWQPVESGRITVDVGARTIPANRYVIARDVQQQVVVYWYQGRGRVVANEYTNKFWLMVDAARLHRSNGSLVRLIAPVLRGGDVGAADRATVTFARAVFPHLSTYLP